MSRLIKSFVGKNKKNEQKMIESISYESIPVDFSEYMSLTVIGFAILHLAHSTI